MKKLLKNLSIWILIAMVVGILVGVAIGPEASVFKPIGELFIQLIKMLVVPLVLVSIISGAASLGETKSAGLVGGISIGYMMFTTLISIIVAIVLAIVFQPGKGLDNEDFISNKREYVATVNDKEVFIDVEMGKATETSLDFTIETEGIESAKWLAYNEADGVPTRNEVVALGNNFNLKDSDTITADGLEAGNKYGIVVAATTIDNKEVMTEPVLNNTLTPPMGFWDTVIGMIPENPIKALTDGNILQIIIFGLFLGFGISALAQEKRRKVVNGLNTILEALIWCIGKVMYVAPFGVFGLIADATGTFGFDMLVQIANVLWLDLLAVAIIGLGLYPLTVALLSRVPIKSYFRSMIKPQVVSFSTASSLATLPVNMEACDEMGISKQTSGFVLPLGATINMSGNAIYYALLAIFFAQFYGIDLGMAEYVSIAIVCTLGAIGQAGVPGPTLLAAAVLVAAGIPLEGLPLFYALDRIFDMIRTTLNITGDAACAAVVDRFVKRQ